MNRYLTYISIDVSKLRISNKNPCKWTRIRLGCELCIHNIVQAKLIHACWKVVTIVSLTQIPHCFCHSCFTANKESNSKFTSNVYFSLYKENVFKSLRKIGVSIERQAKYRKHRGVCRCIICCVLFPVFIV